MPLRARPMKPNDVRACVEIIAAHPVIGPRYGRSVQDLRTSWRSLLDSDGMTTAVIEEANGSAVRLCAVGIGLFICEEFLRELKTPPLFWVGPELARRITSGNSPVLSDRQVREANSGNGLNLIVWEALPRAEYAQRANIFHQMMQIFLDNHRGFLMKEMITTQSENVRRLQFSVDAGGLFWDPAEARYAKFPSRSVEEFIREPHIVGITQELEAARLGSWVGSLFDYQTPRFGFSRSEQRMLHAALAAESGTDRELGGTLGVSLPTVKKMWLSVYRRVSERCPETIEDCARAVEAERGNEKKAPPPRLCA